MDGDLARDALEGLSPGWSVPGATGQRPLQLIRQPLTVVHGSALPCLGSRYRPDGSAPRLSESLRRPQSGLGRLHIPVLGGRRRDQRIEQLPRGPSDLIDGAIEHRLIAEGRLVEPADLPDELDRGGTDFFVRRGWRVVEQSPDVPAHRPTPCLLRRDRPTRAPTPPRAKAGAESEPR